MPITRRLAGALVAALVFGPAARAQALAPETVTVFAAASLKNALDAIAAESEREGVKLVVSYAASSALARQIEQGAPADLFISADLDWMDYLDTRRLIRSDSRRNLVGNRIVLIAPSDAAMPVELAPGRLPAALKGGRLAMASIAAVPAGKYGKAALESLGLWGEVSAQVAEAENVRAALAFVARGEAPLGIVYETDSRAEPKVKVVARFPETSHPPIVYPVALTASAKPAAAKVIERLRSPGARAAFEREGFTVLAEPGRS